MNGLERSLLQLFRGGVEVPRRHPSRDAELVGGSVGPELRQAARARGEIHMSHFLLGAIALWVAIKLREMYSLS